MLAAHTVDPVFDIGGGLLACDAEEHTNERAESAWTTVWDMEFAFTAMGTMGITLSLDMWNRDGGARKTFNTPVSENMGLQQTPGVGKYFGVRHAPRRAAFGVHH